MLRPPARDHAGCPANCSTARPAADRSDGYTLLTNPPPAPPTPLPTTLSTALPAALPTDSAEAARVAPHKRHHASHRPLLLQLVLLENASEDVTVLDAVAEVGVERRL